MVDMDANLTKTLVKLVTRHVAQKKIIKRDGNVVYVRFSNKQLTK